MTTLFATPVLKMQEPIIRGSTPQYRRRTHPPTSMERMDGREKTGLGYFTEFISQKMQHINDRYMKIAVRNGLHTCLRNYRNVLVCQCGFSGDLRSGASPAAAN